MQRAAKGRQLRLSPQLPTCDTRPERPTMLQPLLLLIHLLSAIFWLGGMSFAYFCLRPATVEVLEPAQRLPLWAATFARFLPLTALAISALLLSGLAMLMRVGFAHAPLGWHLMLTLGLLMSAVFAYVYLGCYPKLRQACQDAAWPQAATELNRIRQLVALNQLLGLGTVVAAVSARFA